MIVKHLKLSQGFDGTLNLSLQLTNKNDIKVLETLTDEAILLDLTLKKHRNKRTLTANGAMWLLLQNLAEVLDTTKDELYLQFLEQYGTFTHIVVKPDAVAKIKREWRTVRELGEITINGQTGMQLQCYFGSSTMDSKEFSVLLNGIIHECEDQGLETLTSKEFDKLIENIDK